MQLALIVLCYKGLGDMTITELGLPPLNSSSSLFLEIKIMMKKTCDEIAAGTCISFRMHLSNIETYFPTQTPLFAFTNNLQLQLMTPLREVVDGC